jgi:hypothetical protein
MSGNGYTGTFYGNASTTAGKFGNGVSFDGTDDGINSGSGSALDDLIVKTICAWVKPDSATVVYPVIIDKGWNFYLSNAGRFGFSQPLSGADVIVETALSAVENSAWQLLCVVHNGANNASGVKLYIDAEEITPSLATDGGTTFTSDALNNLIIGNTASNNNDYNGQIDEVRVYNRALSPREVRDLYEWAPGPVMHLKFDELEGATAFDSVASSSFGGGNDGSISGASWANGKLGGALGFNGNNSYVNAGSKTIIDNLGPLSVSAWIYPRSLGESSFGMIVAKDESGGAGDGSWFLTLGSNSRLMFVKEFANTGMQVYSLTNTIDLNRWQYVTAIWDGGNDASNDVKLLVDGIEVAHSYDQDGGSEQSDAAKSVYIGNDVWQSRAFDGLIDDVRIYNYARTQKQILEDMFGGNGRRPSGASLPAVLDLDFDEGHGGTAYNAGLLGATANGLLYPGTSGGNISSSSMWTKNGKNGGAMELDGTDDYVSVPDFGY